MPEELDARLVPSTVCCWGATIVAVIVGWRAGVVLTVGCGVAAVGLWGLVIRRAAGGRSARGVWVVLAAVVVGAGFAAAGAWQEYLVAGHPLHEVASGRRVWVRAVASDDPKALAEKRFGGKKVMVRAELVEFREGGEVVRAGGAVVVMAPEAGGGGCCRGRRWNFGRR